MAIEKSYFHDFVRQSLYRQNRKPSINPLNPPAYFHTLGLPLPFHDYKFLPPYLGEMGPEVMFFLAMVEPWLRSGWKILAKRPELYPPHTAYACPPLFDKITALQKEYKAVPMVFRQMMGSSDDFRLTAEADRSLTKLKFKATMPPHTRPYFTKHSEYEQRLWSLLGEYMELTAAKGTFWGEYLPSLNLGYFNERNLMIGGAVTPMPPSYQPTAYCQGPSLHSPHIGLQMRNYREKRRNSNVAEMLQAARDASDFLNLPILVYGHPQGTVLPDFLPNTDQLARQQGHSLLEYELRALKNCSLMIAPLSGWMDLMAWLRVPTLVECPTPDLYHNLTRLACFKPQISFMERGKPLPPQIIRLMAHRVQTSLPPTPPSFTLVQDLPNGFSAKPYQ